MKSFITAVAITIVFNLIPAGSTIAQPAQGNRQAVSNALGEVLENTRAARPNDTLARFDSLLSTRTRQSGGGRVLVIPTAEEIEPQDLVTIIEDVTVMCRIFDKKLAQSYLIPGHFGYRSRNSNRIILTTGLSRDSGSTGAMYVQGYGSLFLTEVDFPLSPPPEAQKEKEAEGEDADPLWAQTKQEIYAPDQTNRRKTDDSTEEYDAEKVADLKRTLTSALKHAANVRGLKSDEWVNVTVVSSTVLTIRAKKSDIDAFSEGKLDFEEFRQKVVIVTYPYLPGRVERGRTFPNVRSRSTSIVVR
ncbi:MAG: hypothetical protein ACYSYV_05235 [Planctomycetota bacterium]|jgi:hypothetical protein